jgi:hypothetical protein
MTMPTWPVKVDTISPGSNSLFFFTGFHLMGRLGVSNACLNHRISKCISAFFNPSGIMQRWNIAMVGV